MWWKHGFTVSVNGADLWNDLAAESPESITLNANVMLASFEVNSVAEVDKQ